MRDMTLEQAMRLAMSHQRAGRPAEAEALYRAVLCESPDQPDALHLLGLLMLGSGKAGAAVELLDRAVRAAPGVAAFWTSLGTALHHAGRPAQATEAFERALTLEPGRADAMVNLAHVRRDRGDIAGAAELYGQVIAAHPGLAEAHAGLGLARVDAGDAEGAIGSLKRAIELKPSVVEARYRLGIALTMAHRLSEAIETYRELLAIKPDHAEAMANLGSLRVAQSRIDEGLELQRRAVATRPDFAVVGDALLLSLHYDPKSTPASLFAAHREWAERHERPVAASESHSNIPDPQRKLRIGYISGDFREHAAAFFIRPLFERFDRNAFEVYAYSNAQYPDPTTARLRQWATAWREVFGVPDQIVAERIRDDGIDILVDLAGHTALNRLTVLARRPAPVQATYLGYPNTTGMQRIDYWITDEHLDPPGSPTPASEKLVGLPRAFACYSPPSDGPAVKPGPRQKGLGPTFGAFSNLGKLNDDVLDAWGGILRGEPAARMVIKDLALGDAEAQDLMRKRLAARNIAEDRVILEGWSSFEEYLGAHGRIDVLLDPWPFNGHTTTLHALWMGVPAVTLEGKTHVSRRGAMILRNLGLEELIARSPDQYASIALQLAGDATRLRKLRQALRQRLLDSPLLDASGFMRNLEAAYRRMWECWCAR